tara:strand:+ start:609 stop:836 length:228 start_codon:yes stop_codon:yes gene_type:complete
MIDAVVGAVIMVVATTSLVYSLEVAQKAFVQAGRYPLNSSEQKMLRDFGLSKDLSDQFWQENIINARKQWGQKPK